MIDGLACLMLCYDYFWVTPSKTLTGDFCIIFGNWTALVQLSTKYSGKTK